jgi:hypothetical protein
VLKLEPIELQQHKEQGRHRQHKPGCSIVGEEEELPRPEVDKREGATPHPTIIPRRLSSEHPPRHHKVGRCAEAGTWEVGRHCCDQWLELGKQQKDQSRGEKTRKINTGKQEWGNVDPPAKFPPPFIHSRDVWETPRVALGARTPHVHHPNTDRGPRAYWPVCMGQTIQ